MNLDKELEYLEAGNKMISLNRARQNVRLAVQMGISEEDARQMFYKDIDSN